MRVPLGLGFSPSACDCRWTLERELDRRKGVVFSSAGIIGLPFGLSQNPEEVAPLLFAALAENAIFAVQKLVSLTDFPWGRSRMNCPSSD